ncbi:hypothetical protein BZA77DRAFT_246008 [Pyronema omphalodes]|nr:hypothetical protein BZA77DRAFT_246008 [Pyronema omphalodes]
MIAQDPPRAPPPSRYKTVRRKAVGPEGQAPSQPAAASYPPSPAQPEKLQRNQSRLRKMLRLNTKDTAPVQQPPQVQQSRRGSITSPPGSSHANASHPVYKGIRYRNRYQQRMLESKRFEMRRWQSWRGNQRLRGAFDLTVTIRHDKHGPTAVPILQNCDVATLLEKVRPGHERCILECWPSLGIQRQVRYFEVVTDVMNSWDQGGQSFFKLGKNIWNQSNIQLSQFPASEPMIAETNFYYYVTADKKWSKRSLSMGNGSLHIIKRDSSYGTKEHQTINLDNFDIYFFCDNSALSKLRAPTNFTFALKSQHKQSLFGKNSVYVHYFSIDNEVLFTNWYTTIAHHKARLIAEKNQVATWVREPVEIPSTADPTSPTSPQRGRRHPRPLISPADLAAPPQSKPAELGRSKSLHRNRSVKPGGSGRSTSAHPPAVGLIGNLHQDPFNTGGLLGQGYEAKKAQALKHFKEDRSKDGILQSKQTAMRNHAPTAAHLDVSPIPILDQHRTGTMTTTATEGGVVRRATTTSRPTTAKDNGTGGTLLSFSAAEINTRLPHHAPRSRSNTMTKRTDGPLLGVGYTAQPGEDGIPAMPIAPGSLAGGLGRRGTSKVRGTGHQGHQGPLIDTTEDTGFTGVGLLAGAYSTHGSSTQGHGVRTGRDVRQGETLLNMGPQSMFQPGSLLARREMETGIQGPRIDRSGEDED